MKSKEDIEKMLSKVEKYRMTPTELVLYEAVMWLMEKTKNISEEQYKQSPYYNPDDE